MTKTVPLASSIKGRGPAAILMHGLFGSKDNLQRLANSLADNFRVHSLDARNHGDSPHINSMPYIDMAGDVIRYMDEQKIQQAALIGHSMGGKVMMQTALTYPDRVQALISADISPVKYKPHHRDVFAALVSVDDSKPRSRAEAEQRLAEHIDEQGVRMFLLKNLRKDAAGVFVWRMNLKTIIDSYDDILSGLDSPRPYEGKVLFIGGGSSDYILPDYRELSLALFPNAELKIIQGVGHWLHVEKPEVFNQVCNRFLKA